MSQVCPSQSHQLVAAAIAFRRARRKFPKNYGLSENPEDRSKSTKPESIITKQDSCDQQNFDSSSTKNSNGKPSHLCTTIARGDEREEDRSVKENLSGKPIICSCCRKRNELAKVNKSINVLKPTDERSAGDALGVASNRECNQPVTPSTWKNDTRKSDLPEDYDPKKQEQKRPEIPSRNLNSPCTLCSYSRKQSPRRTSSKLDSADLLCDRHREGANNTNYSGLNRRNCPTDIYNCNCGRKDRKPMQQRSQTKMDSSSTQKDNSSFNSYAREFHSIKRSNPDLLRPYQDCRRCQNHHCFRHQNCCHHRQFNDERNSYAKGKSCLMSDTCLSSSNSIDNRRDCCRRIHANYNSTCAHNNRSKDPEKISTVLEQNDEEYDDSVGTINHKDSLCILVEKYKANKKCRRNKFADETEFSVERVADECHESIVPQVIYQPNINDVINTERRKKSLKNETSRPGENSAFAKKVCKHSCGQTIREADYDRFKNLRSRLIKVGTCCSSKGTPWRHTF